MHSPARGGGAWAAAGAGWARPEKHPQRDPASEGFMRTGKKNQEKNELVHHNQWHVGNFHAKFAATASKKQGESAVKFVLAKNYFWLWLWEEATPLVGFLSF
jgi:hypothetical protein